MQVKSDITGASKGEGGQKRKDTGGYNTRHFSPLSQNSRDFRLTIRPEKKREVATYVSTVVLPS